MPPSLQQLISWASDNAAFVGIAINIWRDVYGTGGGPFGTGILDAQNNFIVDAQGQFILDAQNN